MNQFQVGDIVRCVNGSGMRLRTGREYEVSATNPSYIGVRDCLTGEFAHIAGGPERCAWLPSRFEPIGKETNPNY